MRPECSLPPNRASVDGLFRASRARPRSWPGDIRTPLARLGGVSAGVVFGRFDRDLGGATSSILAQFESLADDADEFLLLVVAERAPLCRPLCGGEDKSPQCLLLLLVETAPELLGLVPPRREE